MKETEFQKHYAYLKREFDFCNSFKDYESKVIVLNRVGKYILNNSDLTDYVVAKSGSGNPDIFLSEITTELKWFERDMPRILDHFQKDINKNEEIE